MHRLDSLSLSRPLSTSLDLSLGLSRSLSLAFYSLRRFDFICKIVE